MEKSCKFNAVVDAGLAYSHIYSFINVFIHSHCKGVLRTCWVIWREQQTRQTDDHSSEIKVLNRLEGDSH